MVPPSELIRHAPSTLPTLHQCDCVVRDLLPGTYMPFGSKATSSFTIKTPAHFPSVHARKTSIVYRPCCRYQTGPKQAWRACGHHSPKSRFCGIVHTIRAKLPGIPTFSLIKPYIVSYVSFVKLSRHCSLLHRWQRKPEVGLRLCTFLLGRAPRSLLQCV